MNSIIESILEGSTQFMSDGHTYSYRANGENPRMVVVFDSDGAIVGSVSLNHSLESASVLYSDDVHAINYFDFNQLEPLAIAQWIAGTYWQH